MRAVPRLCGFYLGICLTNEEKARKNLSQGSRRVPAGTMKIHKYTISIRIEGMTLLQWMDEWQSVKGKGKVIPLQARCGPEGG